MARYPHHSIRKLNKTKLQVRVMQAFSDDHRPLCTSCSASPLHITFHINVKRQFWEPRGNTGSSAIIGEYCQEVGDEKTICEDAGAFFKVEEEKNSRNVVETVLGSLGIKKSKFGRIFKEVMAFGRRYESVGKEKKKGLVVVLTIVETCFGERVAVHEALEKSYEKVKSESRTMGDMLLLVN